jgi:hypothetical protein
MSIISSALLKFLVLDPLGNVPFFVVTIKRVAPQRRLFATIHASGGLHCRMRVARPRVFDGPEKTYDSSTSFPEPSERATQKKLIWTKH